MTGGTLMEPVWTVGQVSEELGVTVRTLHHYDQIGLLRPSGRSRAGYRLYTEADLERLQSIVVYRRLGFPLDEVAELLDADGADLERHLRRQREAVTARLDELSDLVTAIGRALEREVSGVKLTREEQRELFGDGFSEDYAREAQERWGETEAWKQSRARTERYSKADWVQVKAEMEAVGQALVAAKRAGLSAGSTEAMDAAEAHRRHIHERFYDLPYDMHRGLGDMYLADPRFTKTYEELEPGLAQYVRDAIHANADRHAEG
ncbi:MAG TPA: MerR family transcriptional regulator [Dermatophilaceae bacterium]|nr:MerR family transcriptional regulator [Dermatophilaceae bacterium]